MAMKWEYNDGGRSKYFKAENVGDCVCRAITIATGKDYKEVYDELNRRAKLESATELSHHQSNKRSSARNGMFKNAFISYLNDLGWTKHVTCHFGKGVEMHLVEDELPMGTVIVKLSRHLVCVIDHVVQDTYNSSIKEYWDDEGNLQINERRAVYTYWTKEA